MIYKGCRSKKCTLNLLKMFCWPHKDLKTWRRKKLWSIKSRSSKAKERFNCYSTVINKVKTYNPGTEKVKSLPQREILQAWALKVKKSNNSIITATILGYYKPRIACRSSLLVNHYWGQVDLMDEVTSGALHRNYID